MVVVTLTEIAAATWGTLSWGKIPLLGSAAIGLFCVVVNCLNYQCVAHAFIHLPFFSRRPLNRVFSVVSSVALLAPQSLYAAHHLDHHRYNNDRPDPETGRTRDGSSTYRYSRRPGEEEGILSYAFIGPWRVDYPHLVRRAARRGDGTLVWVECMTLVAYAATLGLLNWRGLVLFLVPAWYLGQSLALAHNYAEHHGAKPGNRLTDSVSCYGRLYNLFWFNEGYHQEHHYRPQTHWTRLPTLRSAMLPEQDRRVVRFTHWLNFFGSKQH